MTDQEDIAIKVEEVYKDFDLPHEAQNSFKTRILHPMSKGKNIERQHALKNISFEIKKGEFFGIVGRNGSGKSTLLKILAEIYTPTKGKVTINGSLTPFIELGVGFNPELTGRENVYLNGAMLGFSNKEMESMYDEIVEFAELDKFMDQKLKNYSSGMQVRLAFSVAIRAQTNILLLDEVLAVGDEAFQRKCFNFFKQLKREHKTVVLVTHSMDAVREYCDRAILIDDSKMVQMGKSADVAIAYSRLFIKKEHQRREHESDPVRLGSGEVLMENIASSVDDCNITITSKIINSDKANSSVPLILGFRIKSPEGRIITGTNTKILGKEILLNKGEEKIISWKIQNVFGPGEYAISLAVVKTDGSFIDWIEEALKIQINRPSDMSMPISPPTSFSIR